MPDYPAAHLTPAGAAWLVSATHGQQPHGPGEGAPETVSPLPCGTVFDVVNAPGLFGRGLLERLWASGPGSGPVAAHRGRILLFAAPGTAHRLPALLRWEEWGGRGDVDEETIPPLLFHGTGDAVTVPPARPAEEVPTTCRWLVAPEVRHPWLPGPEVLLWACVRAARSSD